jgi:hypothetical protein
LGGVLIAIYPLLVDMFTSLFCRSWYCVCGALFIAPVGLLMGMPFPHAVRALRDNDDLIPWAWAANGSASVVSAVLAAVLAVSWGFTPVLVISAGLYLLAGWLVKPPDTNG